MLTPGERLGRYELTAPLGSGGGGEVWEALFVGPAGFRRKVAIKLLSQRRIQYDPRPDMLLHEARLGALVSHPNVVSTLELGEHEGRWFMVMDLVRGLSCDQLLKSRGPFPPAALVDVLVQACQGLDHIHSLYDHDDQPLQLVHRDIKPGNLLVTRRGLVRIVDLGVARLAGEPGEPTGTPGYLAPEQLDGQEDQRADLFALGATALRLALDHRLFGRGLGALSRLRSPGPDVLLANDRVPQRLEAYLSGFGSVVSAAMRTDPEARPATAHGLEQALRSLRAHAEGPSLAEWMAEARPGGSLRPPTLSETLSQVPSGRPGFVGRRRERAALARQLGKPGTLLVTGPAGVGKSRLVEEVAGAMPGSLRVDLTGATGRLGVIHAVAEVLSLSGKVDEGTASRIGLALAMREAPLLVLDGVEHLVAPVAELVRSWRAQAPGLVAVCVSSVALPLEDLVVLRVGPLPLADGVELFRRRGGADVEPVEAEALVRAMGRLPLAIELAAGRARVGGLEAAREATPQDALAAGLERSWSLLSPMAQRALTQLSSFTRGFSATDAAAVFDASMRPLELLGDLADHSLVEARRDRFRLLATVRDFVRARAGEALAAADLRHASWSARHGSKENLAALPNQVHRYRAMREHLDDLVLAFRRAEAQGHDELLAPLALAAGEVLLRTGPISLGIELVDRALTTGRRRAALCLLRSGLASFASDAAGARTWAEQGAESRDDPHAQLRCAQVLAYRRAQMEPSEAAVEAHRQAVEGLGRSGSLFHARALGAHGQLLRRQGRIDEALEAHRQGMAEALRIGDEDTALIQARYAECLRDAGRPLQAQHLLAQAVASLEKAGHGIRVLGHRMNLAAGWMDLGRFEEAEEELAPVLAIDPSTSRRAAAWGRLMAAQLAVARGDAEGARALAEELLGDGPHDGVLDVVVRFVRGQALMALGERGPALEELEAVWQQRRVLAVYQQVEMLSLVVHGLPVDRARAWVEELDGSLVGPAPPWIGLKLALARARVARASGDDAGCDGELARASMLLSAMELPAEAEDVRVLAALRQARSSSRRA